MDESTSRTGKKSTDESASRTGKKSTDESTSRTGKKSMEIFQCCYTHAGRRTGAAMSAGWETVAVSANLPGEALKICKRAQNAASPNHPGIVDEQGNVLDLFETVGAGNWLCVIRTRYGQTDSLGRPNMFSHGFIFSWKDPAVLWDPNVFLSFDRDNFRTDEADAVSWDGILRRENTPPLSIDGALKLLNMDMPRYAVLIRCVYAQMCEGKNPKPLYILSDGSGEQLRALLYLIYAGLPGYLRRTLSVTSSANALNLKKNLVLTPLARDKESYLIPQTGENNLLTSRMEHRISRYRYPDYAPLSLPAETFPTYFRALDRYAATLGDVTASNESVLKLAWQWTAYHEDVTALPDSELEAGLSAGLHCGLDTDTLYQTLSALLGECVRRGVELSGETEPALEKYLSARQGDLSTKSRQTKPETSPRQTKPEISPRQTKPETSPHQTKPETSPCPEEDSTVQTNALTSFFHQAGRYYLQKYHTLPREEALTRLTALPVDLFPADMPPDSPELSDLYTLWRDTLEHNAYEIYQTALQNAESASEIFAAVTVCLDTVGKLYPAPDAQSHTRRVRERFWNQLSFARFPFDDFARYESLRVGTPACERAFAYAALVRGNGSRADSPRNGANGPHGDSPRNGANGSSVTPNGAFLLDAYKFFTLYPLHDEERQQAVGGLCGHLARHAGPLPPHYPEWLDIVSRADSDEVFKRVRNLYENAVRFHAVRLEEEYPKFLNACRHAGQDHSRRAAQNETRGPDHSRPAAQNETHGPDHSRPAAQNETRGPEDDGIAARVTELLEQICREHDDKRDPIPLDLWLRLGEYHGENCFAILDHTDAAILSLNASQTVRTSALMKLPAYREAALEYLDRRGEYSRAARWLRAAKIPMGKRAAFDPPPDTTKGGIFSLFRR